MSAYLHNILEIVKNNDDLQFYNLMYEFELLFKNISQKISEDIQKYIYMNKGDLSSSYDELLETYTYLKKIERRTTLCGE